MSLRTVAWVWHLRRQLGLSQTQLGHALEKASGRTGASHNNKLSRWQVGSYVPRPGAIYTAADICPSSLLIWSHPLWPSIELEKEIAGRFSEVLTGLPQSLTDAARRFEAAGRVDFEDAFMLRHDHSLECLACMIAMARYGAEVHRNDSAGDIGMMITEKLLVLGDELLELGIAGPLHGLIDECLYPLLATGGGTALSSAGTSFVEACLLLGERVQRFFPGMRPGHLGKWKVEALHADLDGISAAIGLLATGWVGLPVGRDGLSPPVIDDSAVLELKQRNLESLRQYKPALEVQADVMCRSAASKAVSAASYLSPLAENERRVSGWFPYRQG